MRISDWNPHTCARGSSVSSALASHTKNDSNIIKDLVVLQTILELCVAALLMCVSLWVKVSDKLTRVNVNSSLVNLLGVLVNVFLNPINCTFILKYMSAG